MKESNCAYLARSRAPTTPLSFANTRAAKAVAATKPASKPVETKSDRTECGRFIAEFGPEGGVWFSQGKTFKQCEALRTSRWKAECAKLDADRAKLDSDRAKANADFAATERENAKRRNVLGANLARFAAGIKLPNRKAK